VSKDKDGVVVGKSSRASVVEVNSTTRPDLLQSLYDEVLVKSFSRNDLGAPWWKVDTDTLTQSLLALDSSGDVIGGAVSELFPHSRVRLLYWLAIRPELRGQGIGTLLMNHVAQSWYGQPGQKMVVGEIDDPRYWSGDSQDPLLRLKFYHRLGVRALDRPYFVPAVGPGYVSAYHVFLVSFDATAPAILPNGRVDGIVVRTFINEYLKFAAKFSTGNQFDQESEWLLSFYDGSAIPLVPLLEYESLPDLAPPGQTQ
jgi:GNAT superfamily N-acetyltransferase